MRLVLDCLRGVLRIVLYLGFCCALYIAYRSTSDAWSTISLPTPIAVIQETQRHLVEAQRRYEEISRSLASAPEDESLSKQIKDLERSTPPLVRVWPPGTNFAERSKHFLKINGLKALQTGARASRDKLLAERTELAERIDALNDGLIEAGQSVWGRVYLTGKRHWKTGLLLGCLVLGGPMLFRAFWYYSIAPLITSRAESIRLCEDRVQGLMASGGTPAIHCSKPEKRLPILLQPKETLCVRASWLSALDGHAKKRTQFLWRWDAPLISYAAGLVELTRVDAVDKPVNMSLSSGRDADSHITCIDLRDHPGLIFHPRHVVGVIQSGDSLRLCRYWRLASLHAWCTLQLRYISLSGTGKVIMWGVGGIEPSAPCREPQQVNQSSVAGFDGRLSYSVRRNETFWYYFVGKQPLFDDCFQGEHSYLMCHGDSRDSKGGIDVWFDRILTACGKVLGF